MNRGLVVALVGSAIGVAVGVGVAAITGRATPDDRPGAPAATEPATTRLPSPDPSYWTPERMRSAAPAPMPPD